MFSLLQQQGVILAGLIANAMSLSGFDSSILVDSEDPIRPSWQPWQRARQMSPEYPSTTNYRFQIRSEVEGYAYSIDGIPIMIALAILSFYLTYILVFVAYTFLSGVSSSSWDSIAKLTTIAMLSTPPEKLRNTAAGIETVKLFSQPVSIQVNEKQNLELVFQEDDTGSEFQQIVKDVKY